jgi:hypothetical protein
MPGGAVVAGTQQAAIELITRQAADATATFLTGDYLRRSLEEIEQRAGVPIRYGLSAAPIRDANRGTNWYHRTALEPLFGRRPPEKPQVTMHAHPNQASLIRGFALRCVCRPHG